LSGSRFITFVRGVVLPEGKERASNRKVNQQRKTAKRARRAEKVRKRRRKGTVADQSSLDYKQERHQGKRKPQVATRLKAIGFSRAPAERKK